MENKTHYRKVFKSDHLGSADLEEMIEEGKPLIFTIKEAKQEFKTKVAGKLIDANIVYFQENIKPLVVNATNGKVITKFAESPFVEDWKNISIELYIDKNVRMKGEVVGGVRVKEIAPQPFNEKGIKIITAKIAACLTLDELTKIYNSDIKIKTNTELIEKFKEKKQEILENQTS
jgi:hypothetical protein